MSKKNSDKAIAKVPAFASRVALFTSKLQISRYAAGNITDYCHALQKAVLQVGKLPEEFTQADLEGYLQSMLNRKPLPAEARFKHFIYGLKCYLRTLGHEELPGLVLPPIRRDRKLPRVMSTEQVRDLLRPCELYTKALFSTIYDCGLRAFEACNPPEGKVIYDWKDYRNGGKHKQMTMHAKEFLHLLSLHILPRAFVRIRHYGLLSPSNRDKVRKVQIQLGGTPVPKEL